MTTDATLDKPETDKAIKSARSAFGMGATINEVRETLLRRGYVEEEIFLIITTARLL